MRVRFLFYKQERIVSSTCMKWHELVDLIVKEYPGAQILAIEVMETKARTAREPKQPYAKWYESNLHAYSDPVSVA